MKRTPPRLTTIHHPITKEQLGLYVYWRDDDGSPSAALESADGMFRKMEKHTWTPLARYLGGEPGNFRIVDHGPET